MISIIKDLLILVLARLRILPLMKHPQKLLVGSFRFLHVAVIDLHELLGRLIDLPDVLRPHTHAVLVLLQHALILCSALL